MIVYRCEKCGQQMKVRPERQGKKGKCVHCGVIFLVPTTGESIADDQGTPSVIMSSPLSLVDQPTLTPVGPRSLSDSKTQVNLTGSASGTQVEERFDFLKPAEAPGELGRLAHYRVVRVLGVGGMGTVFLADDLQLGRSVALKIMLPQLAANPTNRSRFAREARAVAPLQHDHIITIYQVGEENGVPYLAMQYLQGETLEQRLRKKALPPLRWVLRVGRETAMGLSVAHRKNIIHRDIKPANLWLELSPTDRVKILDFGLARAAGIDSQLTQAGAIVGTPSYMPPEQASGKAVDGRSDLFSLGCVLYQMTTGRQPFRGPDTLAILTALATEIPRSPNEINPKVPPALSDLIDRLISKKPSERPEDAEEVIAAIERIEAGEHDSTREFDRDEVVPAAIEMDTPRPASRTVELTRIRREEPQEERRPRRRRAKSNVANWLIPVGALLFTAVIAIVIVNRSNRTNPVVEQPTEPVNGPVVNLPSFEKRPPSIEQVPNLKNVPPVNLPKDPLAGLIPPRVDSRPPFQPGDMPRLPEIPEREPEKVWDAVPPDKLPVAGSPVLCMTGSSNGRFLVTGDEMNVTAILRMDDRSQFRWHNQHTDRIKSVAVSPDDRLIATCGADGKIFVNDAVRQVVLVSWQASTKSMNDVIFSPDGKYLVAGGDEGVVWIWDLGSGRRLYAIRIPVSQVESIAISPNGKHLAVGERTGMIHMYEFATQKPTLSYRGASGNGMVTSLAFSPDSKMLAEAHAFGSDGFTVFNPVDGKLFMRVSRAHQGTLSLLFTTDGSRIITGGIDRTVKVWNLNRETPIKIWNDHQGQVNGLALTPDSKWIISAGYDPAVKAHKLP